jgi:hypothetical protein
LLKALTEDGRDILHFEVEIGRVLLQLFPLVLLHDDNGKNVNMDFMAIVINIIKYNSAYLVRKSSSVSPISIQADIPNNRCEKQTLKC